MKREEKILTLNPGDYLVHEGEESLNLYWCLEGEFSVTTKVRNFRVDLTTLGAGDLIGELSFVDQKPRSATVRATKESKVIVLPYDQFSVMLENMPKWQKKIMLTLVDKVRKQSTLE